MGEDTQKFQRRTVLVKRTLQLKYAAVVFAAVLFTGLIVGADIYYTMVRFVQEMDPGMMPMLTQVIRMGTVKLIIFLGIMGLVTLFVSHRWAGPIYRFERSAQVVSTGDLTHRVSLRTSTGSLRTFPKARPPKTSNASRRNWTLCAAKSGTSRRPSQSSAQTPPHAFHRRRKPRGGDSRRRTRRDLRPRRSAS
jgi:hypothetical protein